MTVAGNSAAPASSAIKGESRLLADYEAVCAQYPECLVLVRLGDFFELFGDEAVRAAPILGVTLTGRNLGKAGRVAMCGIPHHAAATYMRRLLRAGESVVLWDQVETPPDEQRRSGMRREIARILTAGTILEPELIDGDDSESCLAVFVAADLLGFAQLDVSTGQLLLQELPFIAGDPSAAILDECERTGCVELLLPEGVQAPATLRGAPHHLPGALFDPAGALARITAFCGVGTVAGYGIAEVSPAVRAAGAVLAYAERNRITFPEGSLRLEVATAGPALTVDGNALANLEVLQTRNGQGKSLLQLLDVTRTPMGRRLLRVRLAQPSSRLADIRRRLDSVDSLVHNADLREQLRATLAEVPDLERVALRCLRGTATPADLLALARGLSHLPELHRQTDGVGGEVEESLDRCFSDNGFLPAVASRVFSFLVETPPVAFREGGFVARGVDPELDRLFALASGTSDELAALEVAERESTGIKALRVGYNRIAGYYVEVPAAQAPLVPQHYVRKQTLSGAERFSTERLARLEAEIVTARQAMTALELRLLAQLVAEVGMHARALADIASAVALLDVAAALASVSCSNGWVSPLVDDSSALEIVDGRHPLVEASLGSHQFVPNSCFLEGVDRLGGQAGRFPAIGLITGPNMGGKSTYLRQTALIVLLAQVGSHVPAGSARIGVVDRIFTRIGAHDDIAAGKSTFMVEMTETATILHRATPRSLVILDEVGRGTATLDGVAIARAVVETLHDDPRLGCRTLFATHFQELAQLEQELPRLANFQVGVSEEDGKVTFLHRICDGAADRSFGLHVARLAGLPQSVVLRAATLMEEMQYRVLEEGEHAVADSAPAFLGSSAESPPDQLLLAIPPPHPVVDLLLKLDIDSITPLDALNTLANLADLAGRGRS